MGSKKRLLKFNLMKIRPYSESDFDQCVSIFVSNFDKYFAEYELAEFKTFLAYAATSNTYYVVVDDEAVVACGGFEKFNEQMVLTWGMVRRDLQGKGYGKALTLYRLDAIKTENDNIIVMIDTSQHTMGFYEKKGFVVQSIEKDGFAQGLDKYHMILEN
jgi:ribosomal protein S18 acetylase RimI-like enzyme